MTAAALLANLWTGLCLLRTSKSVIRGGLHLSQLASDNWCCGCKSGLLILFAITAVAYLCGRLCCVIG